VAQQQQRPPAAARGVGGGPAAAGGASPLECLETQQEQKERKEGTCSALRVPFGQLGIKTKHHNHNKQQNPEAEAEVPWSLLQLARKTGGRLPVQQRTRTRTSAGCWHVLLYLLPAYCLVYAARNESARTGASAANWRQARQVVEMQR
jgi:hypothetical protein